MASKSGRTKDNTAAKKLSGSPSLLGNKFKVSKVFICKYCSQDFPSEKDRYVHQVDQHWKDLISQCEVCVKSFLLKESPDPSHKCHLQLSESIPEGQTDEKEASEGGQNDGGKFLARGKRAKSSNKPTKTQPRKVFTCRVCSHVCKSILEMLNHKQSHHTPSSQCHHCNLDCKNDQSVKEHLKLHTKQKWHFCSICNEGFSMKSSLQEHLRLTHDNMDDSLNADDEEDSIPLTSWQNQTPSDPKTVLGTTSDQKLYSCRYCMQKFSEKSAYRDHVKLSHPKNFQCDICSRSYVRRCELKLHEKHHCEERNFICQYCDKSFKRQAHLDCHILSHTGEKKFVCKHCGKSFKAKRTLIGHEMKHSGNQPFQCKDCGIKFTLKSSLLKHEASHQTEGVRHPCPKCDKDFSSKVTLAIHDKAVHLKIKQYVCETCGTAFAYQSHLRKHQMVHLDERPFKCQYCDKHFRLTYSRMLHERQHTGKKPFQCQHCSKKYATKARLQRHEKVHVKASMKAPLEPEMQEVQLYPVALHPDVAPHLTPEMQKQYQTAQAVVLQEQSHANPGVPVCNICGIEFASYNDYMSHQQTHSITQLESHISVNQDVARYHNADTVSVMLSFMSSGT